MRVVNTKLVENLSIDLLIKKKKKRTRKINKNPITGKYDCDACQYNSTRQFNVIRHKKRIHLPKIQRLCCEEIFQTKGDWYKHCEIVHPEKRPSYIAKKKAKNLKIEIVNDDDDDDNYDIKMDKTIKNESSFPVRLSKQIAEKKIRCSVMNDAQNSDNDDDDDDEDDHNDDDEDEDDDNDEDEDDSSCCSQDDDNKENKYKFYDNVKDKNNLHGTIVNNHYNIINYNTINNNTNNFIYNDTYNNYEPSELFFDNRSFIKNYFGVFDDDDDDDEDEKGNDNDNSDINNNIINNNNKNHDDNHNDDIDDNNNNFNDENKENICPQSCSNQLPLKKRKYTRECCFGTPLSTITNNLNFKSDNDTPVKIKVQKTLELKNLTYFQYDYLSDFNPEIFKINPTKY